METRVDEIAPGIYRLATLIPDIAPPAGFTFNQFLIDADQPLLYHCGPRALFPLVSAAAAKVVPLDRLRWIAFGHVEADECGSMNQWLAAAPKATVAHGALGCMVSLNDLADRAPRALENGEVMDLGGKRVRHIDTPHVPHAWEARALYEETTATLFTGDLFAHVGDGPAVVETDIVGPASATEDVFQATCLTAQTAPTIRALAKLEPKTLAVMHGSCYRGNGAEALRRLADDYERRFKATLTA